MLVVHLPTRYCACRQCSEREIHTANPPIRGHNEYSESSVAHDDAALKPSTIRDIRTARGGTDHELYETLKAEHRESQTPLTRAAIKASTETRVALTSGNREWCTPSEIAEAAPTIMGGIDLDPASNDTAQENVKAATYYTAADDGLAREWFGRV